MHKLQIHVLTTLSWVKLGCDRARNYLQTNLNASESDRQMCGIAKRE